MKRLIFVSTLQMTLSQGRGRDASEQFTSDFFDFIKSSKELGETYGVTGAIYLMSRYCFHVVEGGSFEVAEFMYKIKNDSRHQDFLLAYSENIKDKLFGSSLTLISKRKNSYEDFVCNFDSSGLKDLLLKKGDSRLKKLIESLVVGSGLNSNSENESQSLDVVDNSDLLKSEEAKSYNEFYFKLKRWPRPTDLKMNSNILNVCGLMFGKNGADLAKICTANSHITKDEIVGIIDKLSDLSLIEKINKEKEGHEALSKSRTSSSGRAANADGFSNKLLRFLTTAGR